MVRRGRDVNDLSVIELLNGSDDLLAGRQVHLLLLKNGAWFAGEVKRQRDALAAAPEPQKVLPRVERLRAEDQTSDAWGRAIHHLALALEACPTTSPTTREATNIVRQRYMTGLSETRAAYAVEAGEAARKKQLLDADDQARLAAVPAPNGETLLAWVEHYIAAGMALGVTLSGRADDLAVATPEANAGAQRSELIGLLGTLRADIRLALRVDPALPRTLEADVLGLFDEMQRLAEQRRNGPPPGGGTPPPA